MKTVGCIVCILIDILYIVLGIFCCDIDPEVTYPWFAGILHGFFFPIRWVVSWFSDTLYHAVNYTGAYNALFVIFAILCFVVIAILKIIVLSLSSDKNDQTGTESKSDK